MPSGSAATTPIIAIIRTELDDFNRLLPLDDDGQIVIHGHLINMKHKNETKYNSQCSIKGRVQTAG
jgi:hypothetical protein